MLWAVQISAHSACTFASRAAGTVGSPARLLDLPEHWLDDLFPQPASAETSLGLRPRLAWTRHDHRNKLRAVAHALRQPVRDDDLRHSVDRRLRVVTLDEAVLGQEHAAVGVGEVALRLGIWLIRRRARTWP
jgi:hypothetical protein